jgi:hypothetical protein
VATVSLSELLRQLPPVAPADVEAVFESVDPQTLAAQGRRVSSERVINDTSRLYGIAAAFWPQATASQQASLVGFSAELLAVAVHEAHRLELALERFERQADDDRTVREVTAADLGDQWGEALRWKNHAEKALRPLVGGDAVRQAELGRATSGVEDPDELARRLDDLVALARKWLAAPELARVVKLVRLTESYPAVLEQAAAELRRAADAARARKSVQISQGDLDVLDGRNLYLVRHVIDLFDEAHRLDPAIPRLQPRSLANVLGRRRAGKGAAEAEPAAGVEEPEQVAGTD